jgi:EpsI family protein
MSLRRRLVGVALALLLPGLLLVIWSLADGPSMQIPASAMPSQLGPWSGVADQRLEDRILAELRPSSYVARIYEAQGRPSIALYVGFYDGRVGKSKAPHDPEVCFPSAGWETLATQPIEVPVSASDALLARLLDTHQGSARQLVLYWFQPSSRWPRGVVAEELMFLLDALAGRPQYAFVRVVAGVPDAASRSAVLGDLIAFAGELAWPLRAVVSGDPPAAARADEVAPTRDRGRGYALGF